ncbi:MAG TPA: VC0807 family protein [Solirubrobacteraceae bacterium]|jgi:hypothetical protein|nr:VC0807 family protein [Solirubrobacteraceae bacterium]
MTPDLSTQRRRALAGAIVPAVAYLFLRKAIHNATVALAVTDAIAVVYLGAVMIARRRLEPIALVMIVVFAVALALTALSGGGSLPLELSRAVPTGIIGLACLISVAIGKPVLVGMLRLTARGHPELRPRIEAALADPDRVHRLTVVTAILGVACTADAASTVALAFTLSTTSFVVTARAVRLAILGAGVAVLALYIRMTRGPAPR